MPINFREKFRKFLLIVLVFPLFPLVGAAVFFLKNFDVNVFSRNELKHVMFHTNGKITAEWLTETLAMEKNVNLFALDIVAMEKKLKSVPQIKKVFIEKRYPDSLFLRIEEHIPILKIAISVDGEKKMLLVDGVDGRIFSPIGYTKEDMKNILPADVILRVSDRKKLQFFSLPKMVVIKELVEMLRNDFNDIFLSIKFIDLKDYDSRPGAVWSKIELHLKNDIIVTLSPQKFDFQLLRLEYLLNVKCVDSLLRIKRINVAPLNDAIIEYK